MLPKASDLPLADYKKVCLVFKLGAKRTLSTAAVTQRTVVYYNRRVSARVAIKEPSVRATAVERQGQVVVLQATKGGRGWQKAHVVRRDGERERESKGGSEGGGHLYMFMKRARIGICMGSEIRILSHFDRVRSSSRV